MAGEEIRRVVARTMAQLLGPAVEAATAPFQFALSTRAGSEFVAHALQFQTEADPEATITSVNGVSAFDLVSRRALLQGLASVGGGDAALPFVHQFYGRPSTYMWEDEEGTVRAVDQGEGGEQGDAMMPLSSPNQTERERSTALQEELWTHSRIRIHGSKTHVWNQAGLQQDACEALQRVAEALDPTARVRRGSELPSVEQGIKVLGTPIGHQSSLPRIWSAHWHGFLPFQTCSAHGCCCCAVVVALRICPRHVLLARSAP